jgi:hypothetical protein
LTFLVVAPLVEDMVPDGYVPQGRLSETLEPDNRKLSSSVHRGDEAARSLNHPSPQNDIRIDKMYIRKIYIKRD